MPTAIDLKSLNWVGYLQLVAATLVLIPAITMGYAALASRLKTSGGEREGTPPHEQRRRRW